MALFSNPRKKLARDTALHLISGHVGLAVFWTLKYARVLEALRQAGDLGDALDAKVYASRTNMSEEVLTALLDYLAQQGLAEKRGAGYLLSPTGLALLEYEEGVLDHVRAYQPVLGALEHLLAQLKTYGHGVKRKQDAWVAGQSGRYAAEVYPAILRQVEALGATCLLNLACGSGELLVALAQNNKRVVGVGLEADPTLVRQANDLIGQARLEKRLIVVAARLEETCADTRRTFERTGISQQLWAKIDGVVACGAFTELAADGHDQAKRALLHLGKAFPAAALVLAEPTAGLRFERNYYAAEMELLLRLAGARFLAEDVWRGWLTEAGWKPAVEEGLQTDGVCVWGCAARKKAAGKA